MKKSRFGAMGEVSRLTLGGGGVKNREGLKQCVEAEASDPLDPELTKRIDKLGLRV